MSEDFGKEFMMLGGTIAGFVVAMLTLMEKLLDIQNRLKTGKESKSAAPPAGKSWSDAAPTIDFFSAKPLRGTSYLLMYETGVIVAAGLLLNYVGLTLSRHLESILFLDMTGTALVAFLLGPWWGAIAALMSNSIVNWLLYPEAGADVVIFPWSLVSMTGAFYWGWMARRAGFRKYLRTGKSSALSHAWFLYIFGVGGAAVMSLPGTFVQAALQEHAAFALNPEVAETLSARVLLWEQTAHEYIESLFGLTWAESISWWVVNWFQNWVRYVPDKTMSAAIALVVLKYGYPLFERELIHGGSDGERPRDERILPLILGLIYAPSFATLLSSELYQGSVYWPLWAMPWVLITCGYFRLRYWGPSNAALKDARLQRAERYAKALKPIGKEASYEFCRRLTFATLIASLIFALCLPVLLMDFYRVTFKFFCVVYGFLLVVHLIRIAIAQNISAARAD
ncbi:conserved membrane protein of unknown function [Nitrospira japonica]|uniref:Uncharacterized protein n=1 Tax=Nitrospira japonica TaxID=1325564 RepID=A0A1W1I463_9BACT|nr:hypothetical protein [Nitrospira japonica]SLM47792.1 conserved membrane protein of unknown function [Nitrospira japonica]